MTCLEERGDVVGVGGEVGDHAVRIHGADAEEELTLGFLVGAGMGVFEGDCVIDGGFGEEVHR